MLAAFLPVAALLSPQIDLLTMGEGPLLYERYGHVALCVVYGQPSEDTRCYNYGMTDFDMPPAQMGWAFLRGTAEFWVTDEPLDVVLQNYVDRDRAVWRQRLPLEPAAVGRLIARLEHDMQEENRRYTYHHFVNNCATRVRDVIDGAVEGRLTTPDEPIGASFRGLGRPGLAGTPALLLSDFLVTRAADFELDRREGMFLPSVLRETVARRLGVEPVTVYARQGPPLVPPPPATSLWIGLAALLLALPVAVTRLVGRWRRTALAFAATGLAPIAVLLWFVALATTIDELRWNELLLVYWPTDVALPWLGDRALRRYRRARLVVFGLVLAAAAVGLARQPVAPMILPLGVFLALLLPARVRAMT